MRSIQSLTAFQTMIQRGDFVVLDTETTGLQRGEIVQIALVDAQGKMLLDSLVKPLSRIPREATAIHHITDSMVNDAPPWAEVSPQVEKLLRGRDVIVYNASFDRKMMHQSAEAAGLPKVDWKLFSQWWCAMEAFAEVYGQPGGYGRGYRWQKLSTAARYYRIPVVDAHSALGDALLTLKVVLAMSQERHE
jgi:DNA polymerase III epsilon subunit-like protein